MKTDVLIIGAGPTGLALACQLIRYGVDFVIIDRKETTTRYSKAVGVQARTLEIYEQIGLAGKLVALGTIAERARLFAGGKVRGEARFGELGKGLSPYPFVLIVEQGKHEKLLYDHILSHGRTVRWRSELLSFEQTDNDVKAEIRDANGSAETITAKYMVGCDGAKSPVRRALGLEFSGSTFDRMFYVADVHIDWEYGHDALQAFLMKNSLLAFFPMTGEKQYRIVGTFPEEFAKDEGEVPYDEIEEQIRTDSEVELDITEVNWFSTYRVHTRHVEKFSVGRVFLAGDSAHIHSPAGAQGMNTGIQDGYNLAWKLAFVLRGEAGDKLLTTYNEERLPIARQLTQTTDRFFGLVADPNPLLAFARISIFPYVASFLFSLDAVRKFVFPRIAQIAINYRDRSLSHGNARLNVRPGDRMPYFLIDGKSVYDALDSPRFHFVAFGDDGLFGEPVDERMDSMRLPLGAEVLKIFGTDAPFVLVLRPDNYIGWIGDAGGMADARAYLECVLCQT